MVKEINGVVPLGASIDELIDEGRYDLESVNAYRQIYPETVTDPDPSKVKWKKIDNIPNAKVKACILIKPDAKVLEVTAIVGKAQYVYTKEYAA